MKIKFVLIVTLIITFSTQAYLQNLSLDKSFGNEGISYFSLLDYGSGYRIAESPDGSIYILSIGFDFLEDSAFYVITRFGPDGQQDQEFGENGQFRFSENSIDYPSDIKVLEDGRLVVSSFEDLSSATLIFLNQDGIVSSKVKIPFDFVGTVDEVYGLSLSVTSDYVFLGGFIDLVVEEGPISSQDALFIVKTDTDGLLIDDFAANGYYIVRRDGYHMGIMDILATDEYIMSWSYAYDFDYDEERTYLRKLDHSGELMPDFGVEGILGIDLPQVGLGELFIQDGAVILTFPDEMAAIRISSSGMPDLSYGNGIAYYEHNDFDLYGLFSSFAPDGSVIMFVSDGDIDFFDHSCLIGFDKDGEADENIGNNGFYMLDSLGNNYYMNGCYDNSGRLLTTGMNASSGTGAGFIARFNTMLSEVDFPKINSHQWMIYPNPVQYNSMNILLSGTDTKIDHFKIYDIFGNLVQDHYPDTTVGFKINIGDNLTEGMYLVELIGEGHSLGIKKVLINM